VAAGSRRAARAALLSALAWPGLGQLVHGRRGRGALFAVLAAAGLGVLTARLFHEVLVRLPVEPVLLTPGQVWALSREVRQAPGLRPPLLFCVAVWAAAVADALWPLLRAAPRETKEGG
jgi:hypothetical protein